jgi:hypothetical protein
MKVTRADWAGSVPWSGVTGKPDNLLSGTAGADLSRLTARVAAIEAALVALARGSSASPITTLHVEWDIDSLASLQMGYEDVTLTGLSAGTACVLVPQDPSPFLVASATAIAPETARLTAMNVGPAAVTPGLTVWTLFILHG